MRQESPRIMAASFDCHPRESEPGLFVLASFKMSVILRPRSSFPSSDSINLSFMCVSVSCDGELHHTEMQPFL